MRRIGYGEGLSPRILKSRRHRAMPLPRNSLSANFDLSPQMSGARSRETASGVRSRQLRLPHGVSADTNAAHGRETQKTAKTQSAAAARAGGWRPRRDQRHAPDGGEDPRRLRALRL